MLPLKSGVDSFFGKLPARSLFIFLFFYQCLFIFQGLDFADEGFHATFYQQIYNDPQSVQYNFMYWFSGIIGGAWVKVFGGLGLLGMRLAGVLVVTGTVILTYNFLKKYLEPTYLKIALLLIVLFSSNDPKELYYNNLSALFYVLIAWSLLSGIEKRKPWLVFVSGMLVAVNSLTRLPNILELGLVTTIVYAGWLKKDTIRYQFSQVVMFGLGAIAGFGILIGIMIMTGHWQILLDAVGLLVKLGKTEDVTPVAATAKDSGSYYGLMTQLKMFWGNYSISLRYVLLTAVLILVFASLTEQLKKLLRWRWVYQGLKLLLIIGAAIVILSGGKMNNTPNIILLYFFTGLSLVVTLFILLSEKPAAVKILAFIGCFLMVTYPVGSSSGILTAGLYSFWVILPVVINELFKINNISIKGFLGYNTRNDAIFPLQISAKQFSGLKNLAVLLAIVGCLYSAWYFPMHNAYERYEMTSSVKSRRLAGVLTDHDRATAVSSLLEALKPYVKEDDLLLAHDAVPMVHYLTATRPYTGNSYPWLYQSDVYQNRLAAAFTATGTKPVIVRQNITTNGWRGNRWPANDPGVYTEWNKEKNAILDSFIAKHGYIQRWNSKAFSIYTAQ